MYAQGFINTDYKHESLYYEKKNFPIIRKTLKQNQESVFTFFKLSLFKDVIDISLYPYFSTGRKNKTNIPSRIGLVFFKLKSNKLILKILKTLIKSDGISIK